MQPVKAWSGLPSAPAYTRPMRRVIRRLHPEQSRREARGAYDYNATPASWFRTVRVREGRALIRRTFALD